MGTETRTGTDSFTYHHDGGGRIYPCRCGEVHGGEYGFYDWVHHECDHGTVWKHDEMEGVGYCVDCGKTIKLVSGK